MQANRPASVTADRALKQLIITWRDGHESRYSFSGLRRECPCVECRGGHERMGKPADAAAVRDAPISDLNLEAIEAVGSYALQFTWSDGHSTGIYTWDWLRGACPCPECLPE